MALKHSYDTESCFETKSVCRQVVILRFKTRKKSGAHTIKTRFQIAGVLSTMANPNPGSVWSGADAAAREQQKHDFDKNWGLVRSSN